ncbi:hypothetical protein [Tumebacillus lipolyticus]|uniref:Phosphatase n=1 Tax=Tumebacillus lipolyticus TaxID=1280370 RepID=A0ABW4ZX39_9BACL
MMKKKTIAVLAAIALTFTALTFMEPSNGNRTAGEPPPIPYGVSQR